VHLLAESAMGWVPLKREAHPVLGRIHVMTTIAKPRSIKLKKEKKSQ